MSLESSISITLVSGALLHCYSLQHWGADGLIALQTWRPCSGTDKNTVEVETDLDRTDLEQHHLPGTVLRAEFKVGMFRGFAVHLSSVFGDKQAKCL